MYFLPSYGSFAQAVSDEKIISEIYQPEKKIWLWRPYLLTDRDEMRNIYNKPSIATSYQVTVHLPKRFQGRIILTNQPIRN